MPKEIVAVSGTKAGTLLEGWGNHLRNILDQLNENSGQILASLIAENCAFTLSNPVSSDDFAEAALSAATNKLYTKAKKNMVMCLSSLEKFPTLVSRSDISNTLFKLSTKKASLSSSEKALAGVLQEFLACDSVITQVTKRFYSARKELRDVLLDNPFEGSYALIVQSVTSRISPAGQSGYIIPGTTMALRHFIKKRRAEITVREDDLDHLERMAHELVIRKAP